LTGFKFQRVRINDAHPLFAFKSHFTPTFTAVYDRSLPMSPIHVTIIWWPNHYILTNTQNQEPMPTFGKARLYSLAKSRLLLDAILASSKANPRK